MAEENEKCDPFAGKVIAKVLSSEVPKDVEPADVWQFKAEKCEVVPTPGKAALAQYALEEVVELIKK